MTRRFRANLLLTIAGILWGCAFVAQAVGADNLGPFAFNASRFALGSLALLPLIFFLDKRSGKARSEIKAGWKLALLPGLGAGALLTTAAFLQQASLSHTTVGNAAFITGMYIVLTPVIGVLLGHRTGMTTWIGIALAVVGLYLLTMGGSLHINRGDLLCLIGAVFWSCHILWVDRFTKIDPLRLSVMQFVACAAFSTILSVIFERSMAMNWMAALGAIAYGGFVSVGIAYTLQVIAQRDAKPQHAALILSLEALFGALAGAIFLRENLGLTGYIGGAILMCGVIISQLQGHPEGEVTESVGKAAVTEPTDIAI